MTEDRQMIAIAVLEGQLPVDALTLDEVAELQERLFDIITEKHLPHFDTNLH